MRKELECPHPTPIFPIITIPARCFAVIDCGHEHLRISPPPHQLPALDASSIAVAPTDRIAIIHPDEAYCDDRTVGHHHGLRRRIFQRIALCNVDGRLEERVVGTYHEDYEYDQTEEWVTATYQPTGRPSHPERCIVSAPSLTDTERFERISLIRDQCMILQRGWESPVVHPASCIECITYTVERNTRRAILDPGDEVIAYSMTTAPAERDGSVPLRPHPPASPYTACTITIRERIANHRGMPIRTILDRTSFPSEHMT
ncbi:hypothetical protein HY632_00270 [Candidatus Uhrbacteria bacterium]|nr:hypothetical protein [Candidatus Uhrbacteria bacterium]